MNFVALKLNYDGSATFAGKVSIETDKSPIYAKRDIASGPTNVLAQFANNTTNVIEFFTNGDISAGNVTFNLEADDDTKYTATTSEDGEQTLVYNGATLDMKEVGLALVALKSAAAAAADFTTLKSAIATALANL